MEQHLTRTAKKATSSFTGKKAGGPGYLAFSLSPEEGIGVLKAKIRGTILVSLRGRRKRDVIPPTKKMGLKAKEHNGYGVSPSHK